MSSKPMGLKILSLIVILSTFMAGCSTVTPTAAPTSVPPTSAPTIDQAPTLSMAKTQAVQTFSANLTQSAPPATLVPPPATAAPTNPPTPAPLAPTATPLPPPALPTATKPAVPFKPQPSPTLSTYNCSVFYVSPKPSDTILYSTNFVATWRVENSGTENWPGTETYIKYVYGTKFQTGVDSYNIERSVGSTGTYTVNINMKSPKLAGPYYAQWVIQVGGIVACTLNLTLHVVTN